MELPIDDVLNRQIAMGVFALYVVVVSLLRVMAEQEFFRLTALKKIWGRTVGLTIHFVSNVALPLICGIVFISQGIVSQSHDEGLRENSSHVYPAISLHLAGGSGTVIGEEVATDSYSLCPISHPLEILPP